MSAPAKRTLKLSGKFMEMTPTMIQTPDGKYVCAFNELHVVYTADEDEAHHFPSKVAAQNFAAERRLKKCQFPEAP